MQGEDGTPTTLTFAKFRKQAVIQHRVETRFQRKQGFLHLLKELGAFLGFLNEYLHCVVTPAAAAVAVFLPGPSYGESGELYGASPLPSSKLHTQLPSAENQAGKSEDAVGISCALETSARPQ